MEEERKFTYALDLSGSNLSEEVLARKISEINGVISCEINDGVLNYSLNSYASDYDVFNEAVEIIRDSGAGISFGEEEGEGGRAALSRGGGADFQ